MCLAKSVVETSGWVLRVAGFYGWLGFTGGWGLRIRLPSAGSSAPDSPGGRVQVTCPLLRPTVSGSRIDEIICGDDGGGVLLGFLLFTPWLASFVTFQLLF